MGKIEAIVNEKSLPQYVYADFKAIIQQYKEGK
jgi:hypothetical protein